MTPLWRRSSANTLTTSSSFLRSRMLTRIRFHLDESVNPALAAGLQHRGVDVTTTLGMHLRGTVDDDQLAFAVREHRVLITHDRDFLRLNRQGIPHAGIAYCAQQKYPLGGLLRAVLTVWMTIPPERMVNNVTFL